MRNKINLLFFLIDIMLNSFISIFLCNHYSQENFRSILYVYIFSLFTYWFLVCIFNLKKVLNKNSIFVHIFFMILSCIFIILCLFNISKKIILSIPLMCSISIFLSSLSYEIIHKDLDKKN